MKTLPELAHLYATDKREEDHNYVTFYEKYFEPLRDLKLDICEIGILEHPDKINRPYGGASLLMWRDYFHNSGIYGIDINDHSYLNKEERIRTYVADQSNREQLGKLFNDLQMDIIIEDGGHWMHQQQISLGMLFKNVKPGGIFVIEDLHTSHPDKSYNNDPSLCSGQIFKRYENETLTLDMLEKYCETNVIESNIMTPQEIQYLNDNIEKIVIEHAILSPIAFIFKKQ